MHSPYFPPPFSVVYDAISSSSLSLFCKNVLVLCSQIPPGYVSSYKAISDILHSSPRAGNVLKRNPFSPTVPCHRVIASNGYIGGFKGNWGIKSSFINSKLALLENENVHFDDRGVIVDPKFFTAFDTCALFTLSNPK